jgi:hypothetical protein
MYNEIKFLEAISNSFKNYQVSGPRSTEKLKPIHLFWADTLKAIFGEQYQLHYLGGTSKEKTVKGKYYPKDIDITMTHNEHPIFCLGLKFVTSNYKQNANNYFENMMGETANIQANQGIPYAHVLILRYETPYYQRDNVVKKIEIINEKDLSKYLELAEDGQQAHRPYAIGILLVAIDELNAIATAVAPASFLKADFATRFENHLSIRNLVVEIEAYKNNLSTV